MWCYSQIGLVLRRVFSENNWQTVSGQGHYFSSAHYLVISSSPISGFLPYQSFNHKNLYQWNRNLFSFFPAYNLYFRLPISIASGILIIFNQIYKNRGIYSVLYINHHGKSIFVIITSVFHWKLWKNWINIFTTIIGSKINYFWYDFIFIQ